MARPWITPQKVIDYTDLDDVKQRSTSKLQIDIQRAEAYIIKYCHEDFSDTTKYPTIPNDVIIADIILTEYYAHGQTTISQKQSETFDDYSYTTSSAEGDLSRLGLDSLLEPYVNVQGSGRITMNLRKL